MKYKFNMLVEEFADWLADQNPRFDSVKFIEACS